MLASRPIDLYRDRYRVFAGSLFQERDSLLIFCPAPGSDRFFEVFQGLLLVLALRDAPG